VRLFFEIGNCMRADRKRGAVGRHATTGRAEGATSFCSLPATESGKMRG
jgi:hypothetical protein